MDMPVVTLRGPIPARVAIHAARALQHGCDPLKRSERRRVGRGSPRGVLADAHTGHPAHATYQYCNCRHGGSDRPCHIIVSLTMLNSEGSRRAEARLTMAYRLVRPYAEVSAMSAQVGVVNEVVIERNSECPVTTAIGVIAGKWKPTILCEIRE